MKNREKDNGSVGMSFTSLLTLLFIALKLTGQIDWSWWLVLLPSYGLLLLVVAILILITVIDKSSR